MTRNKIPVPVVGVEVKTTIYRTGITKQRVKNLLHTVLQSSIIV